jgi:hypothetical protein
MSINRYRFDGVDLVRNDDGRWVKYDDHVAAIGITEEQRTAYRDAFGRYQIELTKVNDNPSYWRALRDVIDRRRLAAEDLAEQIMFGSIDLSDFAQAMTEACVDATDALREVRT